MIRLILIALMLMYVLGAGDADAQQYPQAFPPAPTSPQQWGIISYQHYSQRRTPVRDALAWALRPRRYISVPVYGPVNNRAGAYYQY